MGTGTRWVPWKGVVIVIVTHLYFSLGMQVVLPESVSKHSRTALMAEGNGIGLL